jgi:hypothetical protein
MRDSGNDHSGSLLIRRRTLLVNALRAIMSGPNR